MKTLNLLRHAKSDQHAQVRDHERPLAKRGLAAAEAMTAQLRADNFAVERIYCSSAKRTRETYELMKPAFSGAMVTFLDELYLMDESGLLAFIRTLPDEIGSTLFIGHNPGFHMLATALTKGAAAGHAGDLAEMREKYPTCALATLTFSSPWAAVKPGTGLLTSFLRPKDLD